MSFLHPLALFGLAAAAIPPLLHLLERREPPEAEFPALRYLSQAERQSARRLRLRHLLLLLLRTTLIALVVLAAARPLVPAPTGAGGTHEPTALVVILDNSPSAGVVTDGRPLLERLRGVARASLAAAGSDDRLWLVLADGVTRRGTRPALIAAVESATVSARRLDLTAAVERAAAIVSAEPVPGREVDVVSDLQQSALGAGRIALPGGVRVLALAPLAVPPPNRGVGAARVVGKAVLVNVVGTPGTGAVALTVRLGGRVLGRALAAPGATVSLPLPTLGPGWWLGEAALDPDELRADDRRSFVWHVAPAARVGPAPDAGEFVRAALAVLREGKRVADGSGVAIGTRPGSGASVVLPPADPALVGETNRALAARGVAWRFAGPGTPGPIAAALLEGVAGVEVDRRERITLATREGAGGSSGDSDVLATVNGEAWLVRDSGVVLVGSRLDTAWTALPVTAGFVPFVDALVNRLASGEAPVAVAEGAIHVEFRTHGADTLGATVYGPDPRESDLTAAPAGLVERALGARVLDERRFAAARFAGGRRTDMSGLLLVLALLVAAVELGVATLGR